MITQLTYLVIGAVGVGLGAILGYFARQSIAKKQIGTLEERIEKRITQAKQEAGNLIAKAKQDSSQILEKVRKEEGERRAEVLKAEKLLLSKESELQQGLKNLRENKKEVFKKAEKIKELKENLNQLIKQEIDKLEKIAGLDKEKAKEVLLEKVEQDCQKDV
ncbi:MAG: Rnase Y domain-containing protein, partial [Acidobacteriota bacterium]|nr:Rnase Y domain-containing protein [Acidobacteriota bacterium]